MNGVPVLQVKRKGKDAVHFLTGPLTVGEEATGKIDWNRRWDHMQQHSSQHLITAIADSIFGFKTTSWWLGEYLSHIELGIFLSFVSKFMFYLNQLFIHYRYHWCE